MIRGNSGKEKQEKSCGRRTPTFMSQEDIASGRKSNWQELEITGTYPSETAPPDPRLHGTCSVYVYYPRVGTCTTHAYTARVSVTMRSCIYTDAS